MATLSVAAPLLSGALLLVQTTLLARVLGEAITAGHAPAGFSATLLSIAALMLARAALGAVGEAAGTQAAETIKRDLRNRLFARTLAQRPAWTAARPSGAMTSALVDSVDGLQNFFARYLPALVAATVLPVVFALAVLRVDLVSGVLLIVTAPLIPLFMALVGLGAEAASRRHQTAWLRLSGLFADRLRGIVTLRLFRRGDAEAQRIRESGDALRLGSMNVLRIAGLSSAVLEFFAALGIAGVALYVGLTFLGFVNLRATPLGLEAGLFCLLMAPDVYLPLRQLAAHYHDRAAAKAVATEVAQLFDDAPDAPSSEDAQKNAAPDSFSSLRLHDVSLRTPDDARDVVSHVDLVVAADESIAILGESGAGKSTLLEAIAALRIFDGAIMLNDVNVTSIDAAALHACVALLPQRPRLFHGTIADNIRLGAPDATRDAVEEAARLACVTDFTDALPQGLDTTVGDAGLGLSGGEIHRVALARIFLHDPAVLLLDEPTAHLPAALEETVLDNISAFAKHRTLIVATHSDAVAARMDRAFRIANGSFLATLPRRPQAHADTCESGALKVRA